MLTTETVLDPSVLLITPQRHADDRGFFVETYNRRALAEVGIRDEFVQDNHSLSREKGVVRGMHFQIDPHPIAKLVGVLRGAIWDVVLDLRHGSPTYGRHIGVELSSANGTQIYVPSGFAHGFVTLEPDTEVLYKVTDHWSPEVDRGVAWDDSDLAIDWPVGAGEAILSDKDRQQPKFADLPRYFEWRTP